MSFTLNLGLQSKLTSARLVLKCYQKLLQSWMLSRADRLTKVVFKSRIHLGELQKLSKILQTKGSNFHRWILNYFFFCYSLHVINFFFQFFIVSCNYEQNKLAKIDSGVHQTFSWLWSWSKWLPYDVTMFPSQWASFPRKQISSCRQCWLLTQFFKQKIFWTQLIRFVDLIKTIPE